MLILILILLLFYLYADFCIVLFLVSFLILYSFYCYL